MFRSTDYLDDLMGVDPSMPTDQAIFRGAAFEQQTMTGPTFNDPGDDRVTFIGDAYDPTVQLQRSLSLPADQAFGNRPDDFTEANNPNMKANVPNVAVMGATIVQSTNDGQWYDTLRPAAGYQLPVMNDRTYALITDDQMGEPFGQHDPYFVEPGVRVVAEKPLDIPNRLSAEPSTEQHPYTGFGSALGQWEWSGMKAAQERPVADSGPWFTDALTDKVPTPTGAGGPMVGDGYEVYASPMTFRAPPVPWDQGTNQENGYYVDSGN